MLINTGVQAIAAPDSETSAACEIITCAIVLRKNLNYLYKHLDTSHILHPLLDGGIITEDVRKEVQSYVPKYAQNVVLVRSLFYEKVTARALKILIAETGEKHIGQKLTEGKYITYSKAFQMFSIVQLFAILPTHYCMGQQVHTSYMQLPYMIVTS